MGQSQPDRSPALSVKPRGGSFFSPRNEGGCAAGCLGTVFFGAFFSAGAAVLWVALLQPLWNIVRASQWVETPCTVTLCEVVGDDTYTIKIAYDYTLKGQQYTGSRYNFMTGATSSRKWKEDVAANNPPGTQARCYVNPRQEDESVFDRGFSSDMLFGLFGLPFLLVGLAGFVYFLPAARRKQVAANAAAKSAAGGVDDEEDDSPPTGSRRELAQRIADTARKPSIRAWSASEFENPDLEIPDEPVTLQPESSPTGNFVGCLIGAIIFHVVVGFFFVARLKDWRAGEWQWLPDLFAIPAALGSLACIAGVIHTFLALFNPRPMLTLSRQAVSLGGEVTLEWFFTKSTASVRSLSFQLQGIESAKYTRGTNTHTDTQKFHDEPLFSTSEPQEIAEGKFTVRIPDDTMHSFFGENNKVIWQISLKGDIPFWPDVTATFPIKVNPHEPVA